MSVLRGLELATEQRQLHLETMWVYLERIAKLPATEGEHEVTEDKLLSTKLEIKTLGKEIKGMKEYKKWREKHYETLMVYLQSLIQSIVEKA